MPDINILDKPFEETFDLLFGKDLDITGAEHVSVRVSSDGTVMWVNVNGVCMLRVCHIKLLEIHK